MKSLALLLALGCLAEVAVAREPVDARKLAGVWEITRVNGRAPGEAGGTMLLTEDGRLVASPTGLKGAALEGTYTVEGEQLTTRLQALEGNEVVTTSTIKRLTGDKLVLIDAGRQEIEYRRKRK